MSGKRSIVKTENEKTPLRAWRGGVFSWRSKVAGPEQAGIADEVVLADALVEMFEKSLDGEQVGHDLARGGALNRGAILRFA